jgi:hypothetical protein
LIIVKDCRCSTTRCRSSALPATAFSSPRNPSAVARPLLGTYRGWAWVFQVPSPVRQRGGPLTLSGPICHDKFVVAWGVGLSMNRSFELKPSTVHERFGDETVILNLDTGSYYSAQGIASVIWALVSDGCSESGIVQRIGATFSGNGDEVARATQKFLDQLIEEALVESHAADDGNVDAVPGAHVAMAPTQVFSAPLLQKYTDMEEMLLLDPIHEVDEHGWPSARRAPD